MAGAVNDPVFGNRLAAVIVPNRPGIAAAIRHLAFFHLDARFCRVVEAAKEQIERFTHTDFTIVPYENYIALAERLLELVPIGGETRAAFFNSGAEAVENAVKFARSYTRRPAVIAFDGGFHGRTLLALSLTSKTHPYKAGLGPFAPEVYRVPFDDLDEIEKAFKTRIAAEEVAAIVFEPVQGEKIGRASCRERVL